MQKHYSYITIDLDKKIYTKLKAVQGDSKSRYILVNLINNNLYYDLSGVTVKIYGMKKDKTIFFNDATIIDATKGQFEIELTNQALAIAGDLKIQILILGPNQEKLSTFSFFIEVAESIIDDAAIESSNEFTALITSLSKLEEWNGYFEETSGKIEEKYTERLNNLDEQFNTIDTQLEYIEKQQLNVKTFGAKGDGETDDLNSFNNTVDYAINNNIKKIIIPAGTYILSDTFKFPSGFMLEGLGEVYIKQIETNSPVIATKEYYDNTMPCGRTKILNINVIGNTLSDTNNHGILIWDYYVTIDRCNISYCGGHGIYLTSKSVEGKVANGNLVENTIKNCHVRYTNLTPINLGEDNNNKITDGILENIMISSNEGCDYDLSIGSSAGWFINNIHTYGKANRSIRLLNCYSTAIDNIYIENYKINGMSIHVQTNVNMNNVSIKVQDTVSTDSSAIKIDKSSLDVGSAICNINNVSLFSYSTNNILGIENVNSTLKVNVNNYLIGGKYVDNVTKYGGNGVSNIRIIDGVNLSKELTDGAYSLLYNDTKLKQYDINKFSGNSEKVIVFKIPYMKNYGKLIGKLCVYGNIYDNGSLLTSYSSDVFISAKDTGNELVVLNKELIVASGFTSSPVLTVSRESSELTITFTPSDNRVTGVVSFDYCVI